MEIFLAVLTNLKILAILSLGLFGVITVVMYGDSAVSKTVHHDDSSYDRRKWDQADAKQKALRKIICYVLIPSAIVACIPDVNELWKVKIGLIKLNMASAENIAKGVEVIERVGRKLECKYLGCEEEKKE